MPRKSTLEYQRYAFLSPTTVEAVAQPAPRSRQVSPVKFTVLRIGGKFLVCQFCSHLAQMTVLEPKALFLFTNF